VSSDIPGMSTRQRAKEAREAVKESPREILRERPSREREKEKEKEKEGEVETPRGGKDREKAPEKIMASDKGEATTSTPVMDRKSSPPAPSAIPPATTETTPDQNSAEK